MSTDPTWRDVIAAEQDPGFRDHLRDLTGRAMRLLGLIGPVAVLLYVMLHVLRGQVVVLFDGPTGALVLWDKLAVMVVAALLFPLSMTRVGRSHGRWLAVVTAVAATALSVISDIGGGDASFSAAWASLFLAITAAAFPLDVRQSAVLAVAVFVAVTVPILSPGGAIPANFAGQLVFLVSITLCMTAISLLVYRTRLNQYRTHQKLVRLNELRTRFFAGITHDIRTPLTLVMGPVSDLLAQHHGELDPSVRRPLHLARRNAEHLQTITDDLLILSQLEHGLVELHRAPIDLGELAGQCVFDHQPLAEVNAITLRHENDGARATVVSLIDPDRIRRVLQNLVSNAIQHTPGGGSVVVRVNRTGSQARIEVADTGPGIDPHDLEHLFDWFYRGVDGSAGTGYGLGLAIAHEFTLLHGGLIDVQSKPGGGATFSVVLPASDEAPVDLPYRPALPPPSNSPEGDDPAEGDGESREGVPTDPVPHVLIVEDNSDMRDYLSDLLAGHYRVTEATRGDDGLSRAQQDAPDLVLSDIMMPGLDGIELCRAIRSDDSLRGVPVVLLTARSDPAAMQDGLSAGATAYLQKPFDAQALVTLLENLVEFRRLNSGAKVIGASQIELQSADEEFVSRARDIVEKHMHNSNFGVEWLADEMGCAAKTLQRRLRKATRLTAAGFIRWLRLERAAQLLESGAANVSEAAYAVGFNDVDHFSRIFKQAKGRTPRDFARSGTDANGGIIDAPNGFAGGDLAPGSGDESTAISG